MATLHLMVGLPCSGKTTRARALEATCSALRLTPDEWQVRLFGQDAADPEHDVRHARIEALLWEIASRALVLGTNVILDYGFWAREEREDYRARQAPGGEERSAFPGCAAREIAAATGTQKCATVADGVLYPGSDDAPLDCVLPETNTR